MAFSGILFGSDATTQLGTCGTSFASAIAMRQIMEKLAVLQDLQLRDRISAENPKVKKLRAQVPESILARFDRLMARGKKGVALVHAGVCSECHLRLSSGTLGSLAHTEEIHICDNCGRYLLLPENEPVVLTSPARPRKSGAKSLAHAL